MPDYLGESDVLVRSVLEDHEMRLFSVLLGMLRLDIIKYDETTEALADYYGTEFATVFEEYMKEIKGGDFNV